MIEVKLNPNSPNCANCGCPKVKYEVNHALCKYCWKVNSTWVVKLFLLMCLEELNTELDRHVTVLELQTKMIEHRFNDGRRTFSYDTVKRNLHNYGRRHYNLVTRRKGRPRKGQKGRPPTGWHISKKGVKFKKNYLERYEDGKPAGLFNKNNAKAFHHKIFIFGFDEKARRIRNNGYHSFAFIFPEIFKKPEWQTDGEHEIERDPFRSETHREKKDRIFNYDNLEYMKRRDAREGRIKP